MPHTDAPGHAHHERTEEALALTAEMSIFYTVLLSQAYLRHLYVEEAQHRSREARRLPVSRLEAQGPPSLDRDGRLALHTRTSSEAYESGASTDPAVAGQPRTLTRPSHPRTLLRTASVSQQRTSAGSIHIVIYSLAYSPPICTWEYEPPLPSPLSSPVSCRWHERVP